MSFEYGIRDFVDSREVTVGVSRFEALQAKELGVRKFVVEPRDRDWNHWIPLVSNLPHTDWVHHDGLGQEIFAGAYVVSTTDGSAAMVFMQVIKITAERVRVVELRRGSSFIKEARNICVLADGMIED
jgi:hypothetical protein